MYIPTCVFGLQREQSELWGVALGSIHHLEFAAAWSSAASTRDGITLGELVIIDATIGYIARGRDRVKNKD